VVSIAASTVPHTRKNASGASGRAVASSRAALAVFLPTRVGTYRFASKRCSPSALKPVERANMSPNTWRGLPVLRRAANRRVRS
jgi:hypothetical protein